jgi:ribose transport system substrate-binding protein
MSHRSSVRLLAVAAAVAFVLSACGSSSSPSTTSTNKVKNIAFFGFAAANSFAQATWAGVQDSALKAGVQAKFFDPNFDSTKQVAQIQDATASGLYQAYVVQADDGNAVVPPIQDAIKAGIKVVGEFTPIGTRYDTIEPQVSGLIFVGEAPVWNGKSLGELGIKACANLNPCKVAYLEGFKALPLDNARTEAVKAALTSSPSVQIVASVEGGYTQASGLKAAQNVLQAHPDVNVMIGSSQAIEGATQAIKDAGLTGKIALIGNGGSTQAVAAVKDGSWFACYVIAEKSSGAKAAQLAIDAANGKTVPSSFDTRTIQNPIGTKDNLGSFVGEYTD